MLPNLSKNIKEVQDKKVNFILDKEITKVLYEKIIANKAKGGFKILDTEIKGTS